MWAPKMRFSATAPPMETPATPAKPDRVAVLPPIDSVDVRYPNPRSGRMKKPKWRLMVLSPTRLAGRAVSAKAESDRQDTKANADSLRMERISMLLLVRGSGP